MTLLLPWIVVARPPFLNKQFGSPQVALSAVTTLTISVQNTEAFSFTNIGFTDILPSGLTIYNSFPSNQCAGTLTATPGTSTITLTGGSIAPNATCLVSLLVQADSAGLKTNTVNGDDDLLGRSGTATTTVITPEFTKSFSPARVNVGQTATLLFTLTNNVVPQVTFGAVSGFIDNLPAGMTVVALGPQTCVGTLDSPNASAITFTQSGGDSLAPGSCTIAVTVKATTPGNIINTANGNRSLFGQNPSAALQVDPPPSAYQVRYASNLTKGDSTINLTNNGANGAAFNGPGFGSSAGNLCINAYAFSPDEQLVACCSCLITPNGLASLSVGSDLLTNTLTGVRPDSVVIKLLSTGAGAEFTGTSCNNSAALAGSAIFPTVGGLLAFGTTLHASTAAGTFSITETPFLVATLSPTELASITGRCTNVIGNGSGFGICNSCRTGGFRASPNPAAPR